MNIILVHNKGKFDSDLTEYVQRYDVNKNRTVS